MAEPIKSDVATAPQTPRASRGLTLRRGKDDTGNLPADERTAQVVLEYESPALAQLAMPVPMRSRYTTYIIFSMFMVLMLIVTFFPIDRVSSGAMGIIALEPATGLSTTEIGIVRKVFVRPGQSVHKGDVLVTFDPTNSTADVVSYQDQVASLTQETIRLRAEFDGRMYLSDGTKHGEVQSQLFTQRHAEQAFQMESYGQQISALRAQVVQTEADLRQYNERLAFAAKTEEKRRDLERLGVGSQLNTISAADARAELLRLRDASKAQVDQIRGTLAAKIADRDAAAQTWQAQTSQALKDQTDKLTALQDSLTRALHSLELIEMRAPFDATVLDVAVANVGSVIQPGSQVVSLTPKATEYVAETVIDSMDAGFVAIGQRAVIKFDAFPYSTHGTMVGKVISIQPDASRTPYNPLTQPVGISNSQMAFGTLYYKVRVRMEKNELHHLPTYFQIVPGMSGSVDIIIGYRTFLEYMFTRIVPAVTEAFREP
ncbi:MAG: HlyD family type I secretion periplasmic adaptor subunit [Alphaproteobacteria bacterium]|nr:HlyD family type I secretion periplasmic adaptor subunit [Alphaproteobacteria bacterium]